MTTDVVKTPQRYTVYRPEEKLLAVEACRRYGVKPTVKLLAELTPGRNPARRSLQQWNLEGLEPDAKAVAFWDSWEASHRQRILSQIAVRVPAMLDSVDRLVAKDLGGEVKNMAIAVGIFYDKLAPQNHGVAVYGGNILINTYGPAQPAAAIIDTSSREV